MIQNSKLIHLITKFLNTDENDLQRKELIEWYDEQSSFHAISNKNESIILKKTKNKLLKSIKSPKVNKPKNHYWQQFAAAAILLLGLGLLIFYIVQKNQNELATETQLAKIHPAQERATITLENGREIELDKLKINEKIQIDNIIISKNEQGIVSYHKVDDHTEVIQLNTIQVPKASIYSLILMDGTKVTLNSGSKLSYPSSFAKGDRKVYLEGEGYFQVAKMSEKQRFIVQTSKEKITVLGTKFNIKAYADETKHFTSLAEGSVSISNHNVSQSPIILKPNQQATNDNKSAITIEPVDIDEVLGWTTGQFCFDGKNTTAIFNEIARWYDVDIDYSKYQRIGSQYKGKIPRTLSLDKLIKLLNFAEINTVATITKTERIKLQLN